MARYTSYVIKEAYTGERHGIRKTRAAATKEAKRIANKFGVNVYVIPMGEGGDTGVSTMIQPTKRANNPHKTPLSKKSTPWIPVKAIRFRDGKLDLRVSKAVKRSMVGGARLGNPGKKRYRYTGALEIVWSPVNQAWFVLWGRGSIETRQVLKVFNDLSEARYYARVDLGAKPLSKGSK